MPNVLIHLPPFEDTRYSVHVGHGIFGQLGRMVHTLSPAPSCGIMSDSNVAPLYLKAASNSLEHAGYAVREFVFPAGEPSKNLSTISSALDAFLHARLERASPIIALGGGVVGDMAGFVAATMLRGLPFIQVPTTLLAAVDASVGGKVGIDHPAGKNLIGAFHHPRMVMADTALLASLPDLELQCGLAECIKHAVIRDAELFTWLAKNLDLILSRNAEALTKLVEWNVRIKAAVVMDDPFEHGVRAILNFGHTFGHALETTAGYQGLPHGQAVALGMVAASHMAVNRGIFSSQEAMQLESLIARAGLPIRSSAAQQAAAPISVIIDAMRSDKKVRQGVMRFILPTRIGHADIFTDVDIQQVRPALEYIAGGPAGIAP